MKQGKSKRPPTCCSFGSVTEENNGEDLVTDSAANFNQPQQLTEESDEGDREETDA